jgi:hypothetical protein
MRQAYAEWAGKAVAHSSRMGVCGARGRGGKALRLGRRVSSQRQVDGEYSPGNFSQHRHRQGRLYRNCPRREIYAEPIRTLRHGRKRVAMNKRLVSGRLLRAVGEERGSSAQPARPGGFIRPWRAERAQESASGRLFPLQRPILLTLHHRNARQGRNQNRNKSPWLSLRHDPRAAGTDPLSACVRAPRRIFGPNFV